MLTWEGLPFPLHPSVAAIRQRQLQPTPEQGACPQDREESLPPDKLEDYPISKVQADEIPAVHNFFFRTLQRPVAGTPLKGKRKICLFCGVILRAGVRVASVCDGGEREFLADRCGVVVEFDFQLDRACPVARKEQLSHQIGGDEPGTGATLEETLPQHFCR